MSRYSASRSARLPGGRQWVSEFRTPGERSTQAGASKSSWMWFSTTLRKQRDGAPPSLSGCRRKAFALPPHSGGSLPLEQGYIHEGAGVPTGTPLADPPLIEMISEDPVLRNTKLIAEAWDCDGLNQAHLASLLRRSAVHISNFPAAESHFCVPSVFTLVYEGDRGTVGIGLCQRNVRIPQHLRLSSRGGGLVGKLGRPQMAGLAKNRTTASTFITAHDGFTLADLVTYNEKHNEANGEDNRDGEQHNLSWNCGEEGPSSNKEVQRLRARQMRNLAAALLLAHGVPMIHMGDEYAHTKEGNNNTYCHDSYLNWFNWDAMEHDGSGYSRFVRLLVHFRRTHPELRRKEYVQGSDIQWHGSKPNEPDWSESSRLVAFSLRNHNTGGGLYVAFNTSHLPTVLELPQWPGRLWQIVIDTGKVSPYDFLVPGATLSPDEVAALRHQMSMWTSGGLYPLLPWSMCLLESISVEADAGVSKASSLLAASGTNGRASLDVPSDSSDGSPWVNTYRPPEVPQQQQKAVPHPGPKQKPPSPSRPSAEAPPTDSATQQPPGAPSGLGNEQSERPAVQSRQAASTAQGGAREQPDDTAELLALNAELKKKLARLQNR
eukprot:jgi/Botrbrau1/2795/Bobra.0125s0007.1